MSINIKQIGETLFNNVKGCVDNFNKMSRGERAKTVAKAAGIAVAVGLVSAVALSPLSLAAAIPVGLILGGVAGTAAFAYFTRDKIDGIVKNVKDSSVSIEANK